MMVVITVMAILSFILLLFFGVHFYPYTERNTLEKKAHSSLLIFLPFLLKPLCGKHLNDGLLSVSWVGSLEAPLGNSSFYQSHRWGRLFSGLTSSKQFLRWSYFWLFIPKLLPGSLSEITNRQLNLSYLLYCPFDHHESRICCHPKKWETDSITEALSLYCPISPLCCILTLSTLPTFLPHCKWTGAD